MLSWDSPPPPQKKKGSAEPEMLSLLFGIDDKCPRFRVSTTDTTNTTGALNAMNTYRTNTHEYDGYDNEYKAEHESTDQNECKYWIQ